VIPLLPRRAACKEEAGSGFRRNLPPLRPAFVALLVGVVLIVGALTFFPRFRWSDWSNIS